MKLFYERPCAAKPLTSYRYRGRYGWIMIGATGFTDALREARRSTDDPIDPQHMQVWNGQQYVEASGMKALILYECSGTVREAFLRMGHSALSVDLKPSDNNVSCVPLTGHAPIQELHAQWLRSGERNYDGN